MKEYYYWIDTENAILYRGECDEGGNELRDTEEAILTDIYEKAGVNPHPEDDEEMKDGWEKIDSYLVDKLGFLPEYDVN